jgi:MFS family permease
MAGLMWGIASDRYGRRLCLLLSMMNVAIFGVLLGFSTSFTMAVLLRLAIGLGERYGSQCVSHLNPLSLHLTPPPLHLTPPPLHLTPLSLHLTPLWLNASRAMVIALMVALYCSNVCLLLPFSPFSILPLIPFLLLLFSWFPSPPSLILLSFSSFPYPSFFLLLILSNYVYWYPNNHSFNDTTEFV